METQIQKTRFDYQHSWMYCLGEIFLVFLPVFLVVNLMSSWVGENPIRNLGVLWVANVLMLAMVWTGLRLRGQTWKDFGLTFNRVSPSEALRTFALSWLVFAVGIGGFLMGSILMSTITEIPESADFSGYDFLKGHLGWLFVSLAGVYIVSSFGEEVVYRAFLISRISQMAKNTKYSRAIAVLISSAMFGLAHFQWGPVGIIQTGFMGLAMGVCYVKLSRRLWVLVLAHAYMDTILLVQLYLASN